MCTYSWYNFQQEIIMDQTYNMCCMYLRYRTYLNKMSTPVPGTHQYKKYVRIELSCSYYYCCLWGTWYLVYYCCNNTFPLFTGLCGGRAVVIDRGMRGGPYDEFMSTWYVSWVLVVRLLRISYVRFNMNSSDLKKTRHLHQLYCEQKKVYEFVHNLRLGHLWDAYCSAPPARSVFMSCHTPCPCCT